MSEDSRQLLDRVKLGDESAAAELFQNYLSRLIGLAQKGLSQKLARRLDAEDIVQSAYRSFFRKAQADQIEVERQGDLWRVLAAITVNKLRQNVEFHTAQKRSFLADQSVVISMDQSSVLVPVEKVAHEPSPIEAAALVDEVERLMQGFDSQQREMIELRLQGYTIEEIAAKCDRAERTVRRLMDKVREVLATQISSLNCSGSS